MSRNTTSDATLEDLVAQAKAGGREALEAVLEAIQDDVYGLALRMLWHPEDAADASQEILVKVVTHLASFRGDPKYAAPRTLTTGIRELLLVKPLSFIGTDAPSNIVKKELS